MQDTSLCRLTDKFQLITQVSLVPFSIIGKYTIRQKMCGLTIKETIFHFSWIQGLKATKGVSNKEYVKK